MSGVGVIAIGRNEGQRLKLCLESARKVGGPVVYVDSGSTDGSVALARALGAEVVELDMSVPFSAARARNAGFDRLMQLAPDIQLVQFVDGDCEIVDGWIKHAMQEMRANPKAAAVCGRRRERFPDVSIYNKLADHEWDRPAGEVQSCGGDAMIRTAAFKEVGGYNPTVVAGEEPEMCQRMREKGWKIYRIAAEMTLHDANMTRFAQWWKRQIRSGYGAMDVATRFGHAGLFVDQVKSAQRWALLFPIAPAQMIRLAMRERRRLGMLNAMQYGALTMIAKWGHLLGQRQYKRDRAAGKNTRLIDYKMTPTTA